MRLVTTTLLKLAWGGFLLVTSLYCLLAFLPYTYHAFIHAPPYLWMLGFVKYHVLLYWVAVACSALAFLPEEISATYVVFVCGQAAFGVWLIFKPFIAMLRNDRSAILWAWAALMPVVLQCAWEVRRLLSAMRRENLRDFQLRYSPMVYAAVIVAVVYFIAGKIEVFVAHHTFAVPNSDLVIVAWSAVSLLITGVMVVSLLNVIGIIAARMPRPRAAKVVLLALGATLALRFLFLRFCAEALSFDGPAAQIYCATLPIAVVAFVLAMILPALQEQRDIAGESMILDMRRPLHLASYIFAAALCAVALALPTVLNGRDWNGLLQSGFTIAFWVLLAGCIYSIPRKRANYSLLMIVAAVVAAAVGLKALQATEIFWARPVGKTDDDIARALDAYATQDASFALTNAMFGTRKAEPCGDMCRIMREYTNIPEAKANVDVNLVEQLTPPTNEKPGERPNIFIFVIDSMRPDYLGAYNSKVTFTPNLDALAHDPNSVALKNVYTQYAGTALSEPAIWSGALLLHAHWMQPFSRVNSLEKLARAEGYKMLVSKDTVLSQILDPNDDLVNLDADKKVWNRFEACSTVQSAMRHIDAGDAQGKPIFFYAQPMNVHQFAQNDQPRDWRPPTEPGLTARIATEVHQVDGCLGEFFGYLHKKGMWDNSIIVLTSDHGDATGELGRISHSIAIYPEVIHVPMIVHLPAKMRASVTYDDSQVSSLIDLAPTLYYLLGHKPLVSDPLFGRSMFFENATERASRNELFLASDVRAVYGILDENGHYLYATYDAPAHSELFDLKSDPTAQHNILTPEKKRQYDVRVINHLQDIAKFYKYQPSSGNFWSP